MCSMRCIIYATDAHLSLVNPLGTVITASDTSGAAGIAFFATDDPGCEGFEITSPLSGNWKLRINASASTAGQRVTGIVNYVTASSVHLSALSPLLFPGDVIRVRAQLAVAGTRRTDVSWTCAVLRPDGVSTPLSLFDDGAHGDSLSGDGIYGNAVTPAGELDSTPSLALDRRQAFSRLPPWRTAN